MRAGCLDLATPRSKKISWEEIRELEDVMV
jgi:hypothetical protein